MYRTPWVVATVFVVFVLAVSCRLFARARCQRKKTKKNYVRAIQYNTRREREREREIEM